MLLRFAVTNHLSIRDRQELSFVPAKAIKDDASGLIDCKVAPEGKLLPAAMIYGANASGKSNIVDAFRFAQKSVLYSYRDVDIISETTHRTAFMLDNHSINLPSKYEVDFVSDEVHFQYGFEVEDNFFSREWLYSYPNGPKQTLFERHAQEFRFGRSLKGKNQAIAERTLPNALFISVATQNAHDDLTKIYAFFRSISIVSPDLTISNNRTNAGYVGENLDARIVSFLSVIGTGVTSARLIETDQRLHDGRARMTNQPTHFEFTIKLDGLPNSMTRMFKSLELGHLAAQGQTVFFPINRESSGTRRIVAILRSVFTSIDAGSPIFIDELAAHLHTQAGEALLCLFASAEFNPKGAQLIATTHDTNLLRSKFLRRDQIWFTEKDQTGATELYPLTDIRTRKGDDIETGYLQGRYGAMPFAGSVSELLKSR